MANFFTNMAFDITTAVLPPRPTWTEAPSVQFPRTLFEFGAGPYYIQEIGSGFTIPRFAVYTSFTGALFSDPLQYFRLDNFSAGTGFYGAGFANGGLDGMFAYVMRMNDQVQGSAFNDKLRGYEGNDTMLGGAGADQLEGGAGNDQLFGEAGNDSLFGDAGNDLLSGGLANDILHGGLGLDSLAGDIGNDSLFGGEDADALSGGEGNDRLSGDAGNDTIYGQGGRDVLAGGQGDDLLVSGGFARMDGGAGTDVLVCGQFEDVIIFNSTSGLDFVYGFDAAIDQIDVTGLPAATSLAAVQAAIHAVGSAAVLELGGQAMVFDNMTVAQLRAADFLFAE